MGIVYLAKQVSLDRLVALKILGRSLTLANDKVRFQREAQAVAKLHHPNIVSIHFVGQDHDLCFMVMDYVDGVSIREVLGRLRATTERSSSIDSIVSLESQPKIEGDLERFDMPTKAYSENEATDLSKEAKETITAENYIKRCCEIIRDAARALQHAHTQGVIHRDIKPENLMLARNGQVYVIDFGVARFFEDATLTNTGQLVGTPLYMSPEQVTARIELDHRTDIYSLGIVLYELLTLEPPIIAPTREGVLRKIVSKPLLPVTYWNKAIPKPLENVVHKATAKDADERHQTAGEFASDLDCCITGKSVNAPAYRFKLDESEIIASRPITLTLLSFLFATKGFLLTLGFLYLLFRNPWHERYGYEISENSKTAKSFPAFANGDIANVNRWGLQNYQYRLDWKNPSKRPISIEEARLGFSEFRYFVSHHRQLFITMLPNSWERLGWPFLKIDGAHTFRSNDSIYPPGHYGVTFYQDFQMPDEKIRR